MPGTPKRIRKPEVTERMVMPSNRHSNVSYNRIEPGPVGITTTSLGCLHQLIQHLTFLHRIEEFMYGFEVNLRSVLIKKPKMSQGKSHLQVVVFSDRVY